MHKKEPNSPKEKWAKATENKVSRNKNKWLIEIRQEIWPQK